MVEDLETAYFKDHQNPENSTKGPGLRHLETCPEDMGIIEVPADSADRIFAECAKLIATIKASYPEHHIIVDYTGGTKSMAGGLLMAALGQDNVKVQVMTGKRENLEQVTKGTEAPHPMTTDYVLAARERSRIATLVQVYDYAAALDLSKRLCLSIEDQVFENERFRKLINSEKAILDILVFWDNFNFDMALKHLNNSKKSVKDYFVNNKYSLSLNKLGKNGKKQSSWDLCADLWLNAKRSAYRGRYDDAIARLYRITEASVQAQLYQVYKIPNPIPWESIASQELLQFVRKVDGYYNKKKYIGAGLGLEKSIKFLKDLDPNDKLFEAFKSSGCENGNPSWANKRNKSILAHGYTSIDQDGWNQASQWVESTLRPFWADIEPPQLPQKLPE